MSTLAAIHDEQHQRLEVKLRRELGEQVLQLLEDSLTEDILLNPDGSLWVKRMGQGFSRIGEMPAAQAASALGTIGPLRSGRPDRSETTSPTRQIAARTL